jgi:dTDP-4-dehydrorhamnose reductase
VASRTLLVLGASGFLGPHVVRAARTAGWRVVAAARRPELASWLGGHGPDEALAFEAEDPAALPELLARARPQAIVCALALSRVDACEREPARAERLNAAFPAALARASRAAGVRLVHVSTDLVFGAAPPRAGGFREDDPPAPVHAYGRSKAEGEARVLAADPSALVVRLPLLYGDSGGRGLGASDQILATLARGERPALFTDEWRTPLEAGNAAAALLELGAGDAAGLLHVAGPERLDRHALGLVVLLRLGLPAERVRATTRAELGFAASRPADVALDSSRARALLATPLLAPAAALSSALP